MPGFTETVFTTYTGHHTQSIPSTTYNVSTYVSDPNNATAGLQNAFNAVKATGGHLVFDAITYTINGTVTMADAGRFSLDGNGCTIKAANGMGITFMLHLVRCRNFIVRDMTLNGNRANRTNIEANGHSFVIQNCNSTSVGTGGGTFIKVKSNNAPSSDGFRVLGADADGTTPLTWPRNILFYKCEADNCYRLGMSIINAYNVQVLGGIYSNTNGTNPNSGIDVEPNGGVIPGVDQVLIRGVTLAENLRSGIQLTAIAVPTRITVEGCLFYGGAATSPVQSNRPAGIIVGSEQTLVQKNTFRDFGTNYNNRVSTVFIPNQPTASNNLIFDNSFNNIAMQRPCIQAEASADGAIPHVGNQINDNRRFNCAGVIVVDNDPGTTTSNNTTVTAASNPVPTPPWDVTFAEDGGGLGGVLAYDAESANGAAGVEFSATTSWSHTPVGTPRGVVVQILGRGGTPVIGDIVRVTYGGVPMAMPTNGFAVDTANEVGAAWQFFLGAGIPTGTQTVSIQVASPSGALAYRAHAYTVTAGGDTEVAASGVISGDTGPNISMTLNAPTGVNAWVAGATFSGAITANVTPGTDYTQVEEVALGGDVRCWNWQRRTAISSGGGVIVNWTTPVSDDAAAVGIAVREAPGAPTLVIAPLTGFTVGPALGVLTTQITNPAVVAVIQQGFAIGAALGTPFPIGVEDESYSFLGFDTGVTLGNLTATSTDTPKTRGLFFRRGKT